MRTIVPAEDAHESPLTSPERSEPPSLKRTVPKKRQRIESDDEEANEPASGDELPRPATTRRRAAYMSEDEGDEDPPMTSQSQERFNSQRHDSPVSVTHETPKKTMKKKPPPPSKGRGKGKGDPPPAKKKAKKSKPKAAASSELSDDYEEELSDAVEESDPAMDVDSEEMSDMSEDYGPKKSKGKGRAGARNAGKKKGAKETVIKAKDEGSRVLAAAKGSKPAKVAAKGPPLPASDDMVIDVVGDSQSTRGGASTRPPSPSLADDGGKPKEESSSAAPVPSKKRKLPTIKKIKNLDSSGPGTPSSGAKPAGDSKVTLGDAKPGSRLPAAMVGVADLDLMNKNVYNELFKGAGTNSSGSKEQRKKELDAMRNEWKAKREAEQMQTPAFDLQAQFEKMTRFEERLRAAQSAALFPNCIAGKWRQLWSERSKEQARTEGRSTTDGVLTNGRGNEGER